MLINISQLSKVFRTDEVLTTALDSLSLQIDEGEFVAIMGKSGCGKSTLLNIIGMLDNPSSGSYQFLGEEVTHYSEKQLSNLRKRNIGYIFQNFNLIDELTVKENIELALLYFNVPASERAAKAKQVMEQMGIAHRANHMPAQLSGGQQQRVAVARALISKPNLILADEPTGNLDSQNGEEVMRLLKELNDQGTCVVMVTHSKEHAQHATRIVNLKDGKVVTAEQHAVQEA